MDIFLFDEIMQGSAEGMRMQLDQAQGEDVTIHINSPGGSVPEGIAMASMIKAFKGNVTAEINGLAASMATVIALSTDSVRMVDGSLFMVHNAFFPEGGNAQEMRRKADVAENLSKSIINIYQAKTGLPLDAITDLMNEDTVLTASEAKKLGFVDEIIKLQAVAKFDLNQINDMKLLDEIRNLAASVGVKAEEVDQDELKRLKEEADKKAEDEINNAIDESSSVDEAISAEFVTNAEFIPLKDQITELAQKFAEFLETVPSEEEAAENMKKQAQDALTQALKNIKVNAKVPVKTGHVKTLDAPVFPQSNDAKTYTDFNQSFQDKVQKKLKLN